MHLDLASQDSFEFSTTELIRKQKRLSHKTSFFQWAIKAIKLAIVFSADDGSIMNCLT